MTSDKKTIIVSIDREEALVFFDWLARFNEHNPIGVDDVERQVLHNLEASFESILVEPFAEEYDDILENTKNALRRRYAL